MHLNVQRAFEGTRPAPFASTRLFPKVPDVQDVWLATGTYWLLRVVAQLWLVLLVGLPIMVVPRTAGLWRRAAATELARHAPRRSRRPRAPRMRRRLR